MKPLLVGIGIGRPGFTGTSAPVKLDFRVEICEEVTSAFFLILLSL